MPSFYQADLFRALLRTGKVDLRVIFTNKIPEDRAKLGWQDDLDGFEHEFLSEHRPIIDAIKKARRYRDHIHIVNGLWAGKTVEAVLLTLMYSGSKYFIYSEAPDPRSVVPPLEKKILMLVGKIIVRNAAGLLPISHFAVEYFRSYGAEESRIHPFGYFRSLPAGFHRTPNGQKKERVDIIFVGQLVHRKGVDILLSAMEPLFTGHGNLYLQLIGSGELEEQLRDWVKERKLSHHITFEGAINPRQIMERISEADLLVLPSRWDGWGLVVNEALMAGVPVLVSDMCGAADVVRDGINGYVFRSEDVQALRAKLKTFLELSDIRRLAEGSSSPGAFSRTAMAVAARKTGEALDPENAAEYLVRVLKGGEIKSEEISKYPWIAT